MRRKTSSQISGSFIWFRKKQICLKYVKSQWSSSFPVRVWMLRHQTQIPVLHPQNSRLRGNQKFLVSLILQPIDTGTDRYNRRDNDIVKTVVSLGGKCTRPPDCWHLFARLTHQRKSVPNLPQFFSSDPSEQSLSVSQSQLLGIHRWLSQVKKDAGQETGAWEGQFSSSLPSTQSNCWSHFQCAGMHSPFRQVKAEGAQELSTMKINWSPRCLFLCQTRS